MTSVTIEKLCEAQSHLANTLLCLHAAMGNCASGEATRDVAALYVGMIDQALELGRITEGLQLRADDMRQRQAARDQQDLDELKG